MGGFFGGERPNEPRYRWRGSCPAGDVPEASVGSGSWLGFISIGLKELFRQRSGKKERARQQRSENASSAKSGIRWRASFGTRRRKNPQRLTCHGRQNIEGDPGSVIRVAENATHGCESERPNVLMIRANDGAAPAPQETCLRQASDPVGC